MASRIAPTVTADCHHSSGPSGPSGRLSGGTRSDVQHSSSVGFLMPAGVVLIPTAAEKRRMKPTDRPGKPTGAILSTREVFNRLYRNKMIELNHSAPTNGQHPLYTELANDIKDNIRGFLYNTLKFDRGAQTYSSIKLKYADKLRDLKRMLVSKYSILSAAQSYWVVTFFIKETMQRDRKAMVESAKKEAKRNGLAQPTITDHRSIPDRVPNHHEDIHISRLRDEETAVVFPSPETAPSAMTNGNHLTAGTVGNEGDVLPVSSDAALHDNHIQEEHEAEVIDEYDEDEHLSHAVNVKSRKESGARRAQGKRSGKSHLRKRIIKEDSECEEDDQEQYGSSGDSQNDEQQLSRKPKKTSRVFHRSKKRKMGRGSKVVAPVHTRNESSSESDERNGDGEGHTDNDFGRGRKVPTLCKSSNRSVIRNSRLPKSK